MNLPITNVLYGGGERHDDPGYFGVGRNLGYVVLAGSFATKRHSVELGSPSVLAPWENHALSDPPACGNR